MSLRDNGSASDGPYGVVSCLFDKERFVKRYYAGLDFVGLCSMRFC